MGNRLVFAAWALAIGGPASAAAQQPAAAHREGSWELSAGAGLMAVDASLRGFLGSGAPEYRFANSTKPAGNGVRSVTLVHPARESSRNFIPEKIERSEKFGSSR